jgi:hypothetical protein
MLTVHATLAPNGQVQLPASLAKATPVPVLVTFLEPAPAAAGGPAEAATAEPNGSVAAMLAVAMFIQGWVNVGTRQGVPPW